MNAGTSRADAQNEAIRAALVAHTGKAQSAYPMFEVRDVSAEGAFLAGALLLELDEEFTVELAVRDRRVEVRARVVRLDQGAKPGMAVRFSGLSSTDLETIESIAAAARE